ncbi:SCO4848 family membrane protein [Microbacterium sp. NPDC091313]
MVQTFLAIVLIVNAVFNVVVWPRFYGRIAKDARARDAAGRPTRFLIVHAVLIGIALLLGVVSLVAGVWGLLA